VAVCGKVFLHEVADWSGGERVCVSHYMKDNVHECLEVCCPNWPREEDYLSWLENRLRNRTSHVFIYFFKVT